ncbi:hypothetical protein BJ912DRAFT_1024853 [Pholiota molesta]|nr:hypothetical protein BJ912DRAFT_1024853 [Pholiota molesta]
MSVQYAGYHYSRRLVPSDDIIFTPRTERKHQKFHTTQKRLDTYARNKQLRLTKAENEKAEKEHTKELLFDEVLKTFQQAGISLADFLHYVFKPTSKHVFDWKWRGFFRDQETVKAIFGYWTTSEYNKTTRTFIKDWILGQAEKVIAQESRVITEANILRKSSMVINEDFFLNFSLESITNQLRELAPAAFGLFDAFSTTGRQKRELKAKSRRKQKLVQGSAILALLRSKSQNNNYAQSVIGTYLMATGAQRQHFTVFSALGICTSYTNIIAQATRAAAVNTDESAKTDEANSSMVKPSESDDVNEVKLKKRKTQTAGTLQLLSQACCDTAGKIASSHLFITVYDNINMMIRVAEQVLGRKNAQENGTCATVIPLHNATLEDIETRHLDNGVMNASLLKLEDLQLTENESQLMHDALVHTVLSVIVRYGGDGFNIWKDELEKDLPRSEDTIEVHKSSLHPLKSMEIDENTITGNIQIIEEINAQLKLDSGTPDFQKYVKIIAGDQLTIARQRAITGIRVGHEIGLQMWKHFVLVTGLFHAKIADTHGTLLTHFGVSSHRSPGSLAFHNTCLTRLPIVLTSLPSFRVCRDLIYVSLYARILHCLLLVSGKDSLETYIQQVKSWAEMKHHATEILTRFANADRVQELREPRNEATRKIVPLPTELQGDVVFENACLFMRDALLTRLFANAIKSGDSGLVILVLKQWVFSYRGNGRTKYAHEMLHLFHNLTHVWTKNLRYNWLLNPTGKANAFVEIDLVQEHLNFWIKRVYKAEGGSHSWDWLALVSPCVDILRKLATKINAELGAQQGSKHTVPDLSNDLATLMEVLKEHNVYEIIHGRNVDAEDHAVPDVISVGLAQLSHGNSTNPIAEFNEQFERLRERRKLTPVFEDEVDGNYSKDANSPIDEVPTDSEASASDAECEYDAADIIDPDLEGALMGSPTLQCIDEVDVALDMDGWDLDTEDSYDGMEDSEDDSEEESGQFEWT